MQQHDWSLHVQDVKIGPAVVAVAVIEFGFELHYAADETLQVAVSPAQPSGARSARESQPGVPARSCL
jgi:hypothetical protein